MPVVEEVLERVEREGIKYVYLQFMDILGHVKSVMIPATRFPKALEDGVAFDGSSIVGYATIEESDMRAMPDPRTFQIMPWHEGGRSASVICDIYTSSGERFVGDPRYVLQRVMEEARKMGYVYNTGPEFEFFLFKLDEHGNPTLEPNDSGGYFDYGPMDRGEEVKMEILKYFTDIGYDPEAAHHEVATGQHEIDLRYADALTMADRIMRLKSVIKTVARKHGYHATFMPKPIFGVNGSGMHVHQSLMSEDGGKNYFYDPNGEYELSRAALHFIGGLLHYARETAAVLNSWVNSYKRLVPGYEAPVYITWANRNRSALIRVPEGRGLRTRLELRNPDPAGNPYLQFAVMLAAGLQGIKERIEPPEPVEKDIYHMTDEERKALGIRSLPESLGEALHVMSKSELMRNTLGHHIFEHFLHVKWQEWEEYRAQVTRWEIERFLPVL